MKRVISYLLAVLCILSFIVASQGRAWGYVDPGSGLLALQGFATALAGVTYYMRRRIMALFGRRKKESAKAPALRPAQDRSGKAA